MSTLIENYTYNAVITAKGNSGFYRVTIPASVRNILNVGGGDKVRIGIKDDKIMIVKSLNGLGVILSKDGNIHLPIRLSERFMIKNGSQAQFYQHNGKIIMKIVN